MARAQRAGDGHDDGAPATSRVMGRSIGALYTSGSLLALAWLALPHVSDPGGDRVVAAMACLALVAGLVLLAGAADRVDPAWFHAVIGLIQVVITVAYVAAGDPAGDMRLFYVWATPFACFFFALRPAVAHLLWVGLLLAGSLAALEPGLGEGVRIWMLTFGTLLAVGVLVLVAATGVRRRELALRRAASEDPLTGLANRAAFARRTQAALDRRSVGGGQVFVVLADVDRFKLVNDGHGHVVGDALLVQLGAALVGAVPAGALVARMGGDEFAVLVDDPTGSLSSDDVAIRVARALAGTVRVANVEVRASASVGLAVAADGDTPISLLRDADVAMYRVKRDDPGGAGVFDEAQRVDLARRVRLEADLDRAVHGQLALVYQPVVDVATERIVGAEALLRWYHPDLGPVAPSEFVPIAEESGAIRRIGSWVLDTAVGQLGRWRRDGVVDDGFALSVNVSGRQVDLALPCEVERALGAHGVPAAQLRLELTETVLLGASPETHGALRRLDELGVGLVLDDFGTGASSLSTLQAARFHAVKIDRSFVDGVADTGTDRSIASAILALAAALDLGVVAEGVETCAQAQALRELGCPAAQGFLYAPPLTAEELRALLDAAAGAAVVVGRIGERAETAVAPG